MEENISENKRTEKYPDGNRIKNGTYIPIPIVLQEAEDLLYWCTNDKSVLCKAGLNWKVVEELPGRISALRISQSKWIKEYTYYRDCQSEWLLASQAGFQIQKELIHHLRFALRNNLEEYLKVQRISKRTSNTSLIQNLLELEIMGLNHENELKAVGFDTSKLETAKMKSYELSDLLAKTNALLLDTNPHKEVRKQAETELTNLVYEIRRFGKFAFWQNENRYIGYTSAYVKKINASRKKLLADNASKECPKDTEQIFPTELPET
jgi:hypothetical protein